MRGGPHERIAILQRRKTVASRYLHGEPQWQIANSLEVTQQTVSLDLKAIRAEWLADAKQDYDEIVGQELANLREVERQAWEAWTRSCQNAETMKARMRKRARVGDDDGESFTEKTSKGQAGDPRFLDVINRCRERRCKILGIEAEQRQPDGQTPYKVYLGFSPEDVLCPEPPSSPTSSSNDAPTAPEAPHSPS